MKENLERWIKLLMQSGINSKAIVTEEMRKELEKIKED